MKLYYYYDCEPVGWEKHLASTAMHSQYAWIIYMHTFHV